MSSAVATPSEKLEKAPLTIQEITRKATKAAVNPAPEATIVQGLRYETAAIRANLSSEDYKIGRSAFAEKRSPQFPPLTLLRITWDIRWRARCARTREPARWELLHGHAFR